jgi:thiamine kinase-like enzyme
VEYTWWMVENIYQYKITNSSVKKILSKYYSSLGKVDQIYKFSSVGFNSIIFFFTIKKKKYLIKILNNPDYIYGKKNSFKRLTTITNIVNKLSKKYLFEKFLKNDEGNYVTSYNGSAVRVTSFVESNSNKNKNKIILKRSIKKIEILHQYCWHNLDNIDKNNLKKLPVHYTLKYSFKRRDKIKFFLQNEINKNKSFFNKKDLKVIIKKFEYLCINVKKIKKIENSNFFKLKTFTHNDFHPENIIFDKKNSLYLFDFDNIQYSEVFRCLYLFLLRFSFFKKSVNENDLKETYKSVKKNYKAFIIPNYNESLKYFLYIELEKIFKILCRISEKYYLIVFLKKIINVHLPNVIFLIDLIEKNKKN